MWTEWLRNSNVGYLDPQKNSKYVLPFWNFLFFCFFLFKTTCFCVTLITRLKFSSLKPSSPHPPQVYHLDIVYNHKAINEPGDYWFWGLVFKTWCFQGLWKQVFNKTWLVSSNRIIQLKFFSIAEKITLPKKVSVFYKENEFILLNKRSSLGIYPGVGNFFIPFPHHDETLSTTIYFACFNGFIDRLLVRHLNT